jgi:hypothetical protein
VLVWKYIVNGIFSPNSALSPSFWTGVSSSHWLLDPAWARAVVLEALPLLAGPTSSVSGN